MVKPIGIQRIEKRLQRFDGLIDMSDWASRPSDQKQAAFYARALAAYCVKILADTDDDMAGKSVTDSFHDRGIDAIYFDMRLSRLLLVQSKWGDRIAWKEAGEFVDGVKRLIDPDWASFSKNQKITARRREIELALESSARVLLITVHKGPSRADDQSLKRIDELASAIDGGSGLAETNHWHQQHLLEAIQAESSPPKIDADLYFANWGEIKEPYHAVYGRVQARAITQLWKEHPYLAHMNLRDYSVQRTDVNAAIAKTVSEEPHHFWYFNNGLTLICDFIKPAVVGRLNPELGLFRFEGIRLVNGAQTTGIVSEKLGSLQDTEQDKLWIQLRAIAVGNCPDGFAAQITKFTNLQNAVSQQDFVALDPVQSRLAIDFVVEKRKYTFKWGTEPDPTGESGCTLKEATVALACADPDSWFAVQAKREISILWNTSSARYRKLFHKSLTSQRVWNAVKIMRAVEAKTASLSEGLAPKTGMVGVHLKLLILHLVFRSSQLSQWDTKQDPEGLVPVAQEVCAKVFQMVCQYVASQHEGEYLASLSKNFEKCERMTQALATAGENPDMFASFT